MLSGTSLSTANVKAANYPHCDVSEDRVQDPLLSGIEFGHAVTASNPDLTPMGSMTNGQVQIGEQSEIVSQKRGLIMQEAAANSGAAVNTDAQPYQPSGQVGASIVSELLHESMSSLQSSMTSSLVHKTSGVQSGDTAKSPVKPENSAPDYVAALPVDGANGLTSSPIEQIAGKLEPASQIAREPFGATAHSSIPREVSLGTTSGGHLSDGPGPTIMEILESSIRRNSQQDSDLRRTSTNNQHENQNLFPPPEVRSSVTARPAPGSAVSFPLADASIPGSETQIPLPSVPEIQPKTLPLANGAPRTVPVTQLPDHVAAQIRTAVNGEKFGSIEIRLDPEELGRLRIVLSPRENGMNIAIYTDVQETLELLRRHSGMLQSDFESLGYEQASFTFQQERKSDQAAPLQTTDLNESEPQSDTREQQHSVKHLQAGLARLDLKL
ncbi:flagellar hook-length control protein FliK [Litoreibacter arenae]|uniref:Flagellar hook-length control protein n=1 Tax=Litoreibacter arenae DSM 19593 TaxID=1123360 RepID=S9Q7H9_9RHOB|nr:flagellar hook-length control protein FliK [Litoreibacter arenae]EPX77341.1 flagellar hook-length control protein [Litoreibacter arenae DSM 19593]